MKLFSLTTLLATTLLAFCPLALRAQEQPTVITCDGEAQMISTDKETTITFRDKVVVTGTNLKLNCDFLEVVVKRKGDLSATVGTIDKFRSMLATGNVLIVQGEREAACGRAEVLPEQDRAILTENPVVVFHDQNTRFEGEKIILLGNQKQVLVEKIRLTGPSVPIPGFDKDKKSTTPPATTPATPATK
jgi:lipopolysaccharide export system protein LptA